MGFLSLRISIPEKNATKMMQFDPTTSIFDACRIIREKIAETSTMESPANYGLFLPDEDTKKGVWLEAGRNLDYYILRNGDLLEYKKKLRTLKVRMLDGSLKTLLVDDSQSVSNLMVVICTKIGITNHDEYSLVRDSYNEDGENNKGNFGTLTLKKKKEDKSDRDAKMDLLRKKLKTDDEVNWIDPSKTLREQGVDETETVLLRRKFFFSDQNIDSRDPVQLSLLYVQARDAILDGTHPVIQDQACVFAGIQCQIQFGDFKEEKHKPGFLDLKEFLPQSYQKVKNIEKKIFTEHKKNFGLSELEAKVLYTKTARSLNTYGVTFFLVKEKMKGKNKLVPRLLGVTKDSVLRLDEKTKEILKTWPLTTVRRWGASPNTFTLDFGDYSDQYYSVQTTESEQILQLISGYIDIILKKQKSKDHFGIEGDEGSTMVEDSISPSKATVMQHEMNSAEKKKIGSVSVAVPAVIRACADGSKLYETGNLARSHLTTISGQANLSYSSTTVRQPKITSISTDPQRALVSTIISGQQIIECAEKELSCKLNVPELGNDAASLRWKEQTIDTHKQNVGSQIAAMNAATAQVVTLTSKTIDNVDHTAIGAAISTISSNLPEMTKDIRMIAALLDDDSSGDKLLDAARKLCLAFSNLLKAAEPDTKQPRQNLLSAASSIGEASHQVLTTIGEEDVASQELQDVLLSLAKGIANTTAALVLKAKSVAASCDDLTIQNNVISAATHCALATSQLVACSKVVAPTLSSPSCQSQLMNAIREVTKAVEVLVKVCSETSVEEKLIKDLSAAAADVTKTLNDLLNHIKLINRNEKTKESYQEGAVEKILVATDKLFLSSGDAGEMVRQARIVGQATAQLIQNIKGDAEKQVSSELQKKLLAAAKTLAEATAKMVEAARQCASCPQDATMQTKLRQAVEELRDATTAAATPNIRRNLIYRLEKCAKYAVSSATQCTAALSNASEYNTNNNAQNELNIECRTIVQHIPSLVSGIKGTTSNPDNPVNQLNLISASEKLLLPGSTVVKTAKAILPTITDQASALQLKNCAQQFGIALSDLRSAVNRAREVCSGLEFDAAEKQITALKNELQDLNSAVKSFSLKPLPGEDEESASLKLGSVIKNLEFSIAQLLSATQQRNKNYSENSVREISLILKSFIVAVRGVAATVNQQETQQTILIAAEDVIDQSVVLIKKVRDIIENSHNFNDTIDVENVSKEFSHSLNKCISCLPGQKDIDDAIFNIEKAQQTLSMENFPMSTKNYGKLQNDLNDAAAHLNETSTQILSSSKSPMQLAISLKQYTCAFNNLIKTGLEMAGQTESETRAQVVGSLLNIAMSSKKYLISIKSATVYPTATNSKNQLTADNRSVIDSINLLIDICSSAAPGQVECDNSVRNIQSMLSVLDNPNEPLSDASYFECLEIVMEKSKSLGDGMTGIANYAKKSEHAQFSIAIKGVSSSICGLIEAAGQAAYLAGVSDPSSVAGKLGIVDQAYFFRAAQSINTSCLTLENPMLLKQEVLSAATLIAKHTSALCNACRLASSKTMNPVAKRHFVQSAKEVANSTAILVAEIKALDTNYSDENKEKCILATKPLLKAVNNLCIFASSPEFASQPAKISEAARNSQEPIITAGKSIIESSCAMILAAKSLVLDPKDPPTWQLLANHSKSVSDSIKALVVSIRDKAPGQHECDFAIDKLTIKIRDLDVVSLNAISQTLNPHKENTIQGFLDQMENCASELNDKLEILRKSAKNEAENIGHTVTQMALYCESLVNNGIGSASHMIQTKQQIMVLDQTKTVVECILQLLYVTKESGGNPKAVSLHRDVDDSVDSTIESLHELQNTLETISTSYGIVTGLIDTITRAVSRLEDHRLTVSDNVDSYVNYQTSIVETAREISHLSQELTSKSNSEDKKLGPYMVEISHKFTQLVYDTIGASATSSNTEVSSKLRVCVQELGKACIDIIRSAGAFQMSSNDTFSKKEISDCCKVVNEKVSQILVTLHVESRGTQACISAASTVSGIIGDLDTTIMFATAGTLQAENTNEIFADHRESILKTAKALVEDTKTLVAGAASSQEQLAVAAQNAVSTIVELAEVVKFGAASLGSNNQEAQVMLINAIKDVASALGDLIHATKAASGKVINDPSMAHLKDSAKVMVTNVTSLLKTVKAVEDEHTRGTRALESAIEAISQEMKTLNVSEYSKAVVSPEDIIRCTKSITASTSKAITAGNSCKQDEIIAAANIGRKTVSDTLAVCKSAGNNAKTPDSRDRILKTGYELASNFREIFTIILQNSSNPHVCKNLLIPASRKIPHNVSELLAVAENLKGNEWADPNNLTIVAENELLGAAASIEAAAKKLASIRPRRSIQETNENLTFDEMILEAAKSIADATSALIKAAGIAQKELVNSGKVSRTLLMGSDDGQWSEGLISAARMVAAATHSLVESANSLVQGFSTEEKLISSAKQVASSTAHILVACKVKADPDSESTKRLQSAGNSVKRATDNLVRAAQQAIQHEEERSLVLNRRIVGGIAQEINARSEVLRIERELEEARGRLTAIRQAKYRNRNECSDMDTSTETNFNCNYSDSELKREFEQLSHSSMSALNFPPSDNLRSIPHESVHFINEKEHLVSPGKVNSTQIEMDKRKNDAVLY